MSKNRFNPWRNLNTILQKAWNFTQWSYKLCYNRHVKTIIFPCHVIVVKREELLVISRRREIKQTLGRMPTCTSLKWVCCRQMMFPKSNFENCRTNCIIGTIGMRCQVITHASNLKLDVFVWFHKSLDDWKSAHHCNMWSAFGRALNCRQLPMPWTCFLSFLCNLSTMFWFVVWCSVTTTTDYLVGWK